MKKIYLPKNLKNSFLSTLPQNEVEQKLSEAFYGIITNDKSLFNPLDVLPSAANDKFPEYIAYLLTNPEYFYFIIKYILQIDSWPQQSLVIKEMFNHRFPMLIATRGFGKSFVLAVYMIMRMLIIPGSQCVITSAGFRQAKVVFEYMERIWKKSIILQNCFKGAKNGPTHGTDVWTFRLGDSITYAIPVGPDGSKVRGYRANCVGGETLIQTDCGLVKITDYLKMDCQKVLNINNQLESPDKIYKTTKTDVYKITTANGYSIRCSSVHRLLVTDGKKTSWKYAKDLTKNDYVELDNNDYFPNLYISHNDIIVDEKMAFLFGILISEGTLTNRNYINITHTNKDLIDNICNTFSDFNWTISEKEETIDPRGWTCKKNYNLKYSNTEFRETLKYLGLEYNDSLKKEIPWSILQSPKSVVIEFLKGLFIGDGSCFKYTSKGKSHVGITYYSSSESLINQLQVLLLKFNITCTKTLRYTKLSGTGNYMLAIRGRQAFKMFNIVKNEYWAKNIIEDGFEHKRVINIRKKKNKFVAEVNRCNRNIYLGLYDTEELASSAVNNYINSCRPAFQVNSVELLDEKEQLYDFVMPETESFLGGGFVNHNCLVADEFATLPRQVFEEVMSGFLSVAPSPVEQIKHTAELDAYKKLKIPIPKSSKSADFIQNQLILSGTAYYKINHFYAYYNKWKDVINSKHDAKLRKSLFENEEDYKDINPDDYTIIRIPIELTVSGYMDMAQIARIKASTTKDVYKREYSACFSDDSEGFFKKSLIDSCTVLENDKENLFAPCLYGNQNKKYVIGVDPAYEGDNFAVVVLEINGRQRRVVHCWTTQSSDHKQRLRDGVTKENQYFHFCARKIRSLMKHFPPEYIAIDPLGGGRAVIEALMDPACLETGELLILETIDPTEKPKETDLMTGLHILKIINFTSEWIAESNYSMKKDMEDKLLLFPFSDDVSYALAEYYDESLGDHKSLYDTLDDCIFEIEELKKELTTIVVTESVTGRERFDTPSIKTGIQKKGRLKKDRYSALLMANWVGRSLNIEENRIENPDIVMLTGFGSTLNSNKMFKGNSKVTSKLENLYKNYRM